MLAFQDANSPNDIHGVIKILNLRSGTIYSSLGSGLQLIGSPCWNRDGSELAFFEGTELKVWSLKSNQTRILRKFNKGYIWYRIIFSGDFIGYVGKEANASKGPLVILNARSGTVINTIKEEFNGRIFMLGNTGKIVSEIGY